MLPGKIPWRACANIWGRAVQKTQQIMNIVALPAIPSHGSFFPAYAHVVELFVET
jgi:hypothetical protein